MSSVLTDEIASLVAASHPEPDPVIREMADEAAERGFPFVGPDAGRFLRVAATLAGAERVFEFGSGFGYSAAWFAPALPEGGEIHLTDFDASNLERAEAYLDRLGVADRARFAAGDALESFDDVEGPFDLVFLDLEKSQYVDALDRARGKLRDGGVVIADNVMAGPVEPGEVRAALEGDEPTSDAVAGIAAYVETVRDDPDFETAVVPLGEGLACSRYQP